MSNLSIEEGNKLIAEFMGMYVAEFNGSYNFVYLSEERSKFPATWIHRLQEMKYHSSWDWLMEVVEKIESMGYDFSILHDEDGNQAMVWMGGVYSYNRKKEHLIVENRLDQRDTKIQSVWLTVIQFIQWYNTNSKGEQG